MHRIGHYHQELSYHRRSPTSRYKTAPQGYIASGDGYSRRLDEIVAEIPDKTKCINDTLLWADDLYSSFFQAVDWLDLCRHNGITLNPEKFVFGADAVEFAGFKITMDTVRPCKRYLNAIRDFPTPTSITDVRSWFGLINQVSFAFAATDRMLPFRALLKPGTPFTWNNELDQIFQESKSFVSEIQEGVRIFDKTKPTCLALVQGRNRILVAPKTLSLPINTTLLLPYRLAYNLSRKPLHPRGRIPLRASRRRSPSSCRRP